jgi:hypothetical protein
MLHHPRKTRDDLATLRIVRAHAAQPQTVFLRAVENRKLLLLDEFVALAGTEPERVAVALERQEQLGAVIVFPLPVLTRRAAARRSSADARSQRDTETRTPARRALKRSFLRKVRAQQRLFRSRTQLVQITSQAQRDFFGVQNLAGVVRGTMLAASSAFDARIRLQRDNPRQILSGIEPEIFVARQRRDATEAASR